MSSDEDSSPEETEPADKMENYKDFCKSESDEAYTTITKNQEEYDKQLLVLSTGLLAVIIAFLKDIVHLDVATCRFLLYCCLFGFGSTILCVIVSFQISIQALEKVRNYYQEHYQGDTDFPFPERLGRWVKYINWAGGAFFILAVAFAVSFIAINLSRAAISGGTNGNQESSRGVANEDSGCYERRMERINPQGAGPACPEGEYCKFQSSNTEEIGVPMSTKDSIAKDGAPPKIPQMKVNGGLIPKKPIETGSKKGPKD